MSLFSIDLKTKVVPGSQPCLYFRNLYICFILCCRDQLPSPESLKQKILIKGKRLPPNVLEDEDIDNDGDDDDEVDEEKRAKKAKV